MTHGNEKTASGSVSKSFGFYPKRCDLQTPRFNLQTLPELDELVAELQAYREVDKDWIYSGNALARNFFTGEERTMPYGARVFGLPKTHVLTLNGSASAEDLDFVVWCLSFFTGMRLTATEAGYLDATPIKPGKLVDFVCRSSEAAAVELGLDYLQREHANPRAPKLVAAVIHALFISQYPQSLPFERFQYLYMALDACYKLISAKEEKKPNTTHAGRIEWMCMRYGVPVPGWANNAASASAVSLVRNDAFHEALFFDEPLGFAVHGPQTRATNSDNLPLQMQAVVCRLLVAILGKPDVGYVKTAVDTRQRYSLALE
ncbi:hypothetical protein [Xanthomonas campestris]|uniref:hypothetical protein n=1 Tax=Xanthomonas campestris TaxID=339 RepID=UPI0020C9880A|nr:hypothetical protein [Xanthomonas campestris]MEA9920802.1 hypothetical protein [Xanthomonas campestris pv. raphani]